MNSDDRLFLECMGSLGVTLDGELHEMAVKAMYRDPLEVLSIRLLNLLDVAKSKQARVFLMLLFSVAVWQEGYRAAPKVEFVLQEGGSG